jgi:hypothetical protein
MVSKEFLIKLNTIINTDGEYSEEEVVYIGESLIQFYKTIQKIMNENCYDENITNTTEDI